MYRLIFGYVCNDELIAVHVENGTVLHHSSVGSCRQRSRRHHQGGLLPLLYQLLFSGMHRQLSLPPDTVIVRSGKMDDRRKHNKLYSWQRP